MASIAVGRRLEILLVEDEVVDATQMRMALDEADIHHNLHVVEDGEMALSFLRNEGRYEDVPAPDMALVDISLPKMDGLELLAEIRSDPDLRYLPVVILTGSQNPEHVRRAYELHANLYVTKSVTFDEFAVVLEKVFKVIELPGISTHDDA